MRSYSKTAEKINTIFKCQIHIIGEALKTQEPPILGKLNKIFILKYISAAGSLYWHERKEEKKL